MKKVVAFFHYLVLLVGIIHGSLIKGNSMSKILFLGECPDHKGLPLQFITSFTKINRTTELIDVDVSLKEPLDNRFKLKIEVQKWGDGGWKPNTLNFQTNDPCRGLRRILGKTWINLVQQVNLTRCPIPAGEYHVRKYNLDISNIPILVLAGKFRGYFRLYKKQQLYLCEQAEFTTEAAK